MLSIFAYNFSQEHNSRDYRANYTRDKTTQYYSCFQAVQQIQ